MHFQNDIYHYLKLAIKVFWPVEIAKNSACALYEFYTFSLGFCRREYSSAQDTGHGTPWCLLVLSVVAQWFCLVRCLVVSGCSCLSFVCRFLCRFCGFFWRWLSLFIVPPLNSPGQRENMSRCATAAGEANLFLPPIEPPPSTPFLRH